MEDQSSKKKNEHKLSVLNKYQEVFETSPEWGKLEYRLQLSYANVSIQLKSVYSIVNAVNESKFVTKHDGKVLLDCIINESQIKPPDDFASVCEKGFQDITTLIYGQLEIDKLPRENDELYEVMFVRAAVGKTFMFPSKNITESVPRQEKPESMTGEFDSLFIYDEHLVSKEFIQKYIIYNSSENIMPLYIVQFTINENRYRELREKITCELCEENIVRKYCETEDAYLCISCDQTHHSNRLSQKHKRTEVDDKPKVISYCPTHPSIKLELFCLECNRPICVNCKIKGDHSSGENLMHNLIRVTEKYNDTARVLKEVDPSLDAKKKVLNKEVTNTENKLKEINRKSGEVEDQLYEIMQRALKQLETITKFKMSLLMSDHIELKRQLDEIQWMEKFIKYEFSVLSPNDFLLSWERHQMYRRQAINNSFGTNKILPDMKVPSHIPRWRAC